MNVPWGCQAGAGLFGGGQAVSAGVPPRTAREAAHIGASVAA